MNNIDDLQRLTKEVELKQANIAPDYASYMKMGFAIANTFGEEGREYFLRLCAPSPKFKPADADKLYTTAVRTGHGANAIGTVYHLAQQAGVQLPAQPSAYPYPQAAYGQTDKRTLSAAPHTGARTSNIPDATAPQEEEEDLSITPIMNYELRIMN